MSNIIPLRRGQVSPPATPYEQFLAARRAMLSTFLAWAAEERSASTIVDEADATKSAITQLVEMSGAPHGR